MIPICGREALALDRENIGRGWIQGLQQKHLFWMAKQDSLGTGSKGTL